MPTAADLTSEIEVLEDDVAELRHLQTIAKRPGVHRVLRDALAEATGRIADIRKRLVEAGAVPAPVVEAAAASEPTPAPKAAEPPAAAASAAEAAAPEPAPETPNDKAAAAKRADDAAGISWQTITKFAWDQTDRFVKVYVDLPGVGSSERSYCHFQQGSFDFRAVGVSGKSFRLAVHSLCEAINVKESSVLVKADKFVLRIAKLIRGTEWSGLDDVEKKKKAQHKKMAEGGATTEELLANMYHDADDKTRQELSQAAHEGRKKRETEAARRGW
eukprot:TRINITY_DN48072_c0_g1_i1.p1 TRINITY_DN48072_c0_g1~~TRINITY_DN48072_c0_g1_i1.p1  ORF type:complete len:292 (+),score=109.16 TRINITY_DN48072_c0_g1_i1:57-878(+)